MARAFTTLRQSPNQTTSDYLERFKDQVDLIDECGGTIGFSQSMITSNLQKMNPPVDAITSTPEQYEKAVEAAKQQYLAVAFLSGADHRRYGKMRQILENDYLRGDAESYPQDLTKAYELLLNWRIAPDHRRDRGGDDGLLGGLAFLQQTTGNKHQHKSTRDAPKRQYKTNKVGTKKVETRRAVMPNNKPKPKCWECGQEGHLARNCPNNKGTQLLMDGHTKNDDEGYETAEEYAFITTAKTFQEVEQIAAGEYWSDETLTDNSGYDTDGGPGEPPQRQHQPNPQYDFTYEPPVHPTQIS